MFRRFKKVIDVMEDILLKLASILLCLMTVLIFSDAMGRYLFDHPIGVAHELTELFFMVGIVYLGTSFTFREGGHLKIEFLEKLLPISIKNILKALLTTISAFYIGLIANLAWNEMLHSFRLNQVSPGSLEFPLGFSYLLMFLGVLILCFRLIVEVISLIVNLILKESNTHVET